MAIKQTETANKVVKTQKSDNVYILELKNITKTFLGGKIVANDNVSLSFRKNEIHALVGENGSGKSTLMNILFGLYKQDSGNIFINGQEVDMYSSGAARKHKIGMVHQHFHLVENFSVIDNVILGQETIESSQEKQEANNKKIKELENNLIKFDKSEVEIIRNRFQENFSSKVEYHELGYKVKNLKYQINKHENKLEISNNIVNNKLTELIINSKKNKLNTFENDLLDIKKELDSFEKNKINKPSSNKCIPFVIEILKIKQKESQYNLTGFAGSIKKQAVLNRFSQICKQYNIDLNADDKVETLPVGQRQMVEILKVLWESKDILVFDEPTATLSVPEISALLKTIKSLQKEGKTIIFISHKLKEVKEISNRVSILRKGILIGTHENNDKLKPSVISKAMVGKIINLEYPERDINGEETLIIKNLSYITGKGFKSVDDVSFSVKEGEIFGLAGIEGNGQEEVLKMISGLRKPSEGSITYRDLVIANGKEYQMKNKLRRNFISHIPIDRHKHAMVPSKDLVFNSSLSDFDTAFLSKNSKTYTVKELEKLFKNKSILLEDVSDKIEKSINYFIKILEISSEDASTLMLNIKSLDSKQSNQTIKILESYQEIVYKRIGESINTLEGKELNKSLINLEGKIEHLYRTGSFSQIKASQLTKDIINNYNVEGAYSDKALIKNLSGGNQQKFIVGREMLRDHKILLAGHPTRGLDISAIDMIYKYMIKNSKNKTTILYSLEISELVSVCDRIAIMYKGKIIDIINPNKVNMDKISRMMIGEK